MGSRADRRRIRTPNNRLEGGRVSPSFATLRRYAEATGTRLMVGLVPTDGRDGLTPTTIPTCAGFQAQGGSTDSGSHGYA